MKIYNTLYCLLHSLYYHHRNLEPIADFNEYLERPEIREEIKMHIQWLSMLQSRQWKPVNKRKKWNIEEDEKLGNSYEMGVSINSLAAIHQRTEVAIVKRLNILGKGY